MIVHRAIRTTLLSLLALQILTAAGAIGLLSRSGPAIARLLGDHDRSLAAVEGMLGAVAAHNTPNARPRFDQLLASARLNITRSAETPPLDLIASHADAAFANDTAARLALVDALHQLAAVNRAAMAATADDAQQTARGGAWAAVGLALLSLLLTLLRIRHANRTLISPILELHQAALAYRRGDRLRRCSADAMPLELAEVARAFNELLDERRDVAETVAATRGPAVDVETGHLLNTLLDLMDGPAAIIDTHGGVQAANAAALTVLDHHQAIDDLVSALQADTTPAGLSPLADDRWLVRFDRFSLPPPDPDATPDATPPAPADSTDPPPAPADSADPPPAPADSADPPPDADPDPANPADPPLPATPPSSEDSPASTADIPPHAEGSPASDDEAAASTLDAHEAVPAAQPIGPPPQPSSDLAPRDSRDSAPAAESIRRPPSDPA